MKRLVSIGLAAAALAFAVSGAASGQSERAIERSGNTFHVRACPREKGDEVAACHAHIVTDSNGRIAAGHNATVNVSYTAAQLRAAYSIPWDGNIQAIPSGTLVAIVDAYGYTKAESDLAVYRTTMNLPVCSTANACFTKVNQTGGTSYPTANTGWAQETALDLDMVSAICPTCRILLVQATSPSFSDLATAENTAAALGARVISNSYGGGENGSSNYASAYTHPGVAITVSSGDAGYGVEFPASSPNVTAVGGTSLRMSGNAYLSETAWSGAGSGCSSTYAKPTWQQVIVATCTKRMVADVSAVADPATGVQVYGPPSGTSSAWMVFGGTSVAAPLIAGAYGVNGGTFDRGSNPYLNPSLHDVTSGSNGRCRGVPAFYCNAGNKYDGPTGLGTPIGVSAF